MAENKAGMEKFYEENDIRKAWKGMKSLIRQYDQLSGEVRQMALKLQGMPLFQSEATQEQKDMVDGYIDLYGKHKTKRQNYAGIAYKVDGRPDQLITEPKVLTDDK